jgi:hypothetical protein
VASSIVQDGHGMPPLLADSRPDLVKVKAINLLVGLAVGAAMMAPLGCVVGSAPRAPRVA